MCTCSTHAIKEIAFSVIDSHAAVDLQTSARVSPSLCRASQQMTLEMLHTGHRCLFSKRVGSQRKINSVGTSQRLPLNRGTWVLFSMGFRWFQSQTKERGYGCGWREDGKVGDESIKTYEGYHIKLGSYTYL